MKGRLLLILSGAILAVLIAFLLYTGQYYRADEAAQAAMESDAVVRVTPTGYGWLFDGPSETEALIFYPGAKIEETAYAPLLRRVAEGGVDVCLVRMPFRLAVFGINSADRVIRQHDYAAWFIGGHSLGGAMAASYAAANPEKLKGVVLLAAYATKPLDASLRAITIYGSEDGVLNRAKLQKYDGCLPADCERHVIEGGNHARFGSYGEQDGDGAAAISAEEQQRRTADLIARFALTAAGGAEDTVSK